MYLNYSVLQGSVLGPNGFLYSSDYCFMVFPSDHPYAHDTELLMYFLKPSQRDSFEDEAEFSEA